MEVCGGHTHTIYRHGIEHLLPSQVELVHGPGCPVCVIPMGRVDDAMWLAEQPDVIFTCFGDMMRVPGSNGIAAGRQGARRGRPVRLLAARRAEARRRPPRQAGGVLRARLRDHRALHRGHARAGPASWASRTSACSATTSRSCRRSRPSWSRPTCASTGSSARATSRRWSATGPTGSCREVYGKPLVVAGFEPLDILASVAMLLAQLREGRCEVENQYSRVVAEEGNPAALALMAQVFALRPHFEWRGLGFIAQSALKLSDAYAEFDAELRWSMPGVRVADPKACQCGEVLKGVLKPWECKVFGTACTPETPIGTCMVSPEGACAAYYNFGRMHREAAQLVGRGSAERARRLFARYADAPNALGYCGPPEGDRHDGGRDPGVGAAVLRRLALPAGAGPAHRHGRPARRPAGRGLLAGPRPAASTGEEFGRELLAVLGPQAGAYWTHLTPDLLRRGRPRPRLPRVRRLPVVAAARRGPAAAVRARLLPHPVGHGGRPRPAHRLLAPADLGRAPRARRPRGRPGRGRRRGLGDAGGRALGPPGRRAHARPGARCWRTSTEARLAATNARLCRPTRPMIGASRTPGRLPTTVRCGLDAITRPAPG